MRDDDDCLSCLLVLRRLGDGSSVVADADATDPSWPRFLSLDDMVGTLRLQRTQAGLLAASMGAAMYDQRAAPDLTSILPPGSVSIMPWPRLKNEAI